MRFQRQFEQKLLIIQRQFSKNVTFCMRGTVSLFCCFLSKKERTKGDISQRNWTKTPSNTATISLKCSAFYARYIVFILLFFVKKRTKGEILERIWAKTPYNTAPILKKCNVFYARYIVFILLFFVKKKNKRWDFRENLSKNPL